MECYHIIMDREAILGHNSYILFLSCTTLQYEPCTFNIYTMYCLDRILNQKSQKAKNTVFFHTHVITFPLLMFLAALAALYLTLVSH